MTRLQAKNEKGLHEEPLHRAGLALELERDKRVQNRQFKKACETVPL
jgi:hypothetical protein